MAESLCMAGSMGPLLTRSRWFRRAVAAGAAPAVRLVAGRILDPIHWANPAGGIWHHLLVGVTAHEPVGCKKLSLQVLLKRGRGARDSVVRTSRDTGSFCC